ncbi:Protein of unknown function [Pyronema omphalodes CBS 100304]|uniref:Uncharacterized protein n=1 Tax=Pyronema omphalodes (strain CBS 100304) TaxID=1076935 RepID=U4LIW2_PYROM|nr:Protein of unknown function [Pyronema omphalodes CBS 100304]
MLGPDPRLL